MLNLTKLHRWLGGGRPVKAACERACDHRRIEVIEPLRGLAALSVAWFHFTNGGSLLPHDSWLRASGSFGWIGVEVFFVISGFVIPYSLSRGGYRARTDFGTFLLKRITRLDPPYLVSIAVIIVLAYASSATPSYTGQPPNISAGQLLSHLGYLNAFVGYPWLSPVFWSLAIEFQYYIMIGLGYQALATRSTPGRLLAVCALVLSGVAIDRNYLMFPYGGLFALGILTFQKQIGLWSLRQYLVLLVIVSAVTAYTIGPLIALVGTVTATIIAFANVKRYSSFAFVGSLSYSLYLLHVPIGGKVVNLGVSIADSVSLQIAVLFVAMVSSVLSAYVMFRLVERPAQRWSSSLSYSGQAIPSSHNQAEHPSKDVVSVVVSRSALASSPSQGD